MIKEEREEERPSEHNAKRRHCAFFSTSNSRNTLAALASFAAGAFRGASCRSLYAQAALPHNTHTHTHTRKGGGVCAPLLEASKLRLIDSSSSFSAPFSTFGAVFPIPLLHDVCLSLCMYVSAHNELIDSSEHRHHTDRQPASSSSSSRAPPPVRAHAPRAPATAAAAAARRPLRTVCERKAAPTISSSTRKENTHRDTDNRDTDRHRHRGSVCFEAVGAVSPREVWRVLCKGPISC